MQIIIVKHYQQELIEFWKSNKLTNDQSDLILEEIGRLAYYIEIHDKDTRELETGDKIKIFYTKKGKRKYSDSFKSVVNCVHAFQIDYFKFYNAILRCRQRNRNSFWMMTPKGQKNFEINFDFF